MALIWGATSIPINLALAGLVSGRFAWPLLFISAIALAGGIWLTAAAPGYAILLIVSAVARGRTFGRDAAQSDDPDVERAG